MAFAKVVINQTGAIREFEKPEVCEAIKVANANRWTVGLSPIEWDEREARLKNEHEEYANASDKMCMTLKEAKDILKKEFEVIGIHKSTEPFEFDESRWIEHEKPSVLEAFRVLSKEGYYVTISGHDYDMRKKRLQKEYEENTKATGSDENSIKEDSGVNHALKEAASQFNDALLDEQAKKIKRLGKDISRLNKIIHKKNEELRLTKIREKNLAELGLKYVGENEKLKKNIADKIVDEIDARALKSAESALAYKEKVIAEKDEVIAELDKELDEANKHQQQAYRSCADKNKEIRALKLQISALEKRGNGIDWKRNADAIKLYVNRASHERLWSPISQDICNDQELSFIINHGGKRVKYALRFDGTDIVYECSDPDKKPSFFRDDSVGAVTNQKDSSPVKDTHPTEDNPEEIEIEKAVKLVRKAMKEGRTVTIDYKD